MANKFEFFASAFGPNGLDQNRFFREVGEDPVLGPIREFMRRFRLSGAEPFKIRIKFSRDLTAGEETTLNAIVAAHDPSVPILPGSTLGELNVGQPGVTAGRVAFARDVRKPSEPASGGTGALVYSDGTKWLLCRSDGDPQV